MSLTHINSRCHVILLRWYCPYLKCSNFKLVTDFSSGLHFGFADLKCLVLSLVTFYIVICILMNSNRWIKCSRISKSFDWSINDLRHTSVISKYFISSPVCHVLCSGDLTNLFPFWTLWFHLSSSSSWSYVHAILFCVGKSFKFLLHCVYEFIQKMNLWSSHHLFGTVCKCYTNKHYHKNGFWFWSWRQK